MKPPPQPPSSSAQSAQLVTRYLPLISVNLIVATILFCAIAPLAEAQTFTTLVNFNGSNGANPLFVVLVQGTDGNLYGTTQGNGFTQQKNSSMQTAGTTSSGTVFKITPTGALNTLYSFCAKSKCADGSAPYGGLMLGTDGNFYGTTFSGGAFGAGTVYKLTPTGTLTTLHSFNYRDGANPYDALVQGTDGNYYGTTEAGGAHGLGIVFKITPQGTLTVLHSFNSSDGSEPEAGLIQGSDGNFYGTTYNGGSSGSYGTVFKISPTGVLTTLHLFDENEGRAIVSGLVQGSDGKFYGTASLGGTLGYGTFFTITVTGTLTVLHDFDGSDGSAPNLLLLGTDGNFYGTTISSGANGDGTVFKATPQGTVTVLHSFNQTDGALPFAGPAEATNGNLYGVTQLGGSTNEGTVFRLVVGLGSFVEAVPISGKVGTVVKILGTSLTGATSVSFNGTAATFTVVSASEITTTVPAGATTGTVQVVTPSKKLLSNVAFQVTQ